MRLTDAQLRWFYRYMHRLLSKTVALQVLSDVKNRTVVEPDNDQLSQLQSEGWVQYDLPDGASYGDIVRVNTDDDTPMFAYPHEANNAQQLAFLSQGENTPVNWNSVFSLPGDLIANYTADDEPDTTVGRLLLNYIILAEPFGDVIPYQNNIWKPGDIQDQVADALKNDDVSVKQVKRFVNNSYYMGSLSSLCVVTATEKSFTTDPKIDEKKQELFEKYRGQLDDPHVAKEVENELIAMDKEFLEGDKAKRFLDAMGDQAYNTHRKKMFLTQGAVEQFEGGSGSYEFIMNSLMEGWDPADMATMVNELRKGSFNRGFQTQLGGALAKNMLRLFQNVEIKERDCGTTRTVDVTITDDNSESYTNRFIMEGRSKVLLTADNIGGYTGQTVKMRSPAMCRTENGLCSTCAGNIFNDLDQKGINMLVAEIPNRFMMEAMKSMHGKEIDLAEVEDFSYYFPPLKSSMAAK